MSNSQRRTPILAAALGAMWALRWLTLRCYLRFLFPYLRERSDVPAAESVDASTRYRYAVAYDAYVFLWIALEATALLATTFWPTTVSLAVVQVLAIGRIVDLVRVGLNTSLFDQVTGWRGVAPRVGTATRRARADLLRRADGVFCDHLCIAPGAVTPGEREYEQCRRCDRVCFTHADDDQLWNPVSRGMAQNGCDTSGLLWAPARSADHRENDVEPASSEVSRRGYHRPPIVAASSLTSAKFASRGVELFIPLQDTQDGVRVLELEDADDYPLSFRRTIDKEST